MGWKIIGKGVGIPFRSGGGINWATYWSQQLSALFDTRNGLSIIDSINGETITIKSFPVANYRTTAGSAFYTQVITNEAPITVTGDYTALFIARNENSDSIEARIGVYQINGNNKGWDYINLKSGSLYVPTGITLMSADLYWNSIGKVVSSSEPWIAAVTYDSATNTVVSYLNGTQIDTASGQSAWALGLNTGALFWRGIANYTNARFFGVWIFDRKLTTAEMVEILNTGTFPAITPSRQYIHLNYGDNVSDIVLASHNRNLAFFSNNNVNTIPPDRETMWTSRYDNAVFGYPLFYGYTRHGNFVFPYAPTGLKMMSTQDGDIEFPSSSVIHNMAESMIDFSGITDADIKKLFDKTNRTIWKSSIESTDGYALGAHLWHPTQLLRDFVTTHAETGHENHIFTGVRISGTIVTGITKIAVCKNNII